MQQIQFTRLILWLELQLLNWWIQGKLRVVKNRFDCLYFRYIVDPKNTGKKEILLQNLCEHIGYELYKEPEEFSQKCRNFYKNGEDAKSLGDDMEFYYGAIQLANVHSSKDTNVFVYRWFHFSGRVLITKVERYQGWNYFKVTNNKTV